MVDAKQSIICIYICSEKINSKQVYRTLSFVYFDTHQLSKYTLALSLFSLNIYNCFKILRTISRLNTIYPLRVLIKKKSANYEKSLIIFLKFFHRREQSRLFTVETITILQSIRRLF